MTERKAFIAGKFRATGDLMTVLQPGSGRSVATVHRAGAAEIEAATAAACAAFAVTRAQAVFERSAILEKIAAGLAARSKELTTILAEEAGKPVKAGRAEVDRAVFTFNVAASEARRINGEVLSLDAAPFAAGRLGIVRRFPLGPMAGIIPFNFPLNLAAHKLAPCIASGNTMVLKPASQTPSCALVLAEIAHEAGMPAGALSVVPATSQVAAPLIEDERFRMLTFTGSSAVGWDLKRRAGKKKVTLELGGNAAAIVHEDADIAWAAERIAFGGYSYAGQSCISVQRVLAHETIAARLTDALAARVGALKVGDPLDESTDVGPMITEADAARAEAWIKEAVASGARLLMGGAREGSYLTPAIVTGALPEMKISCREIFAPVVAITTYRTFDEALALVNHSEYGLQAGLFTRDAPSIWKAYETLEVGGLMVDDVPTFRVDHMPYGGVKDSGQGREGLKYAIEEMTEPRLLGWRIKQN